MEALEHENHTYSPEWFRNRALTSIRNLGHGSWDYSDSLLLYLPGSDDEYQSTQEIDTPYNKLITIPERNYLEAIATEVVEPLPNEFEYIDLGPGTEHKEQFIFDAAKIQGKQLVYRPVDISDKYLRLSKEYVSAQGLRVVSLKSSFEESPEKLGTERYPRFVSLGLTYGNYYPSEILGLLKELAGERGTAFINAQIRERTDIEAIRTIYAEIAPALIASKVQLLGIDPERDVSDIEVTDEISIWYTLKNSSPVLEVVGVRAGDRLKVLQSLRPTLEKFEEDISSVFSRYKLLDKGGAFVGALLKESN